MILDENLALPLLQNYPGYCRKPLSFAFLKNIDDRPYSKEIKNVKLNTIGT